MCSTITQLGDHRLRVRFGGQGLYWHLMCTYSVSVVSPKPCSRINNSLRYIYNVSGITRSLEAAYSFLKDVWFVCKHGTMTCKSFEQALI